ncbi:Phosphotyrosyl phosphatase activator [Hesseltinella vesiculosa]|uniref:Serine/threonine-protein phosphatase 2A activator n=1 Tax=Hesseltinella vesiculosa TaxID=101127 RepID=A0A1X2G3G9_9FUNG|nr:Phosphotyrosyl phosphatase activator [Hesseltinella vesiculosa]
MAYSAPIKKIITKEHVEDFLQSDAYNDYVSYILRLSDAVKNKKISDQVHESPNVKVIVDALATISSWVELFPPVENSKSRFGNPSFRDFYDKVQNDANDLFAPVVPKDALPELAGYFVESFGNRTRIDYGTGHEANFMAWLLCLDKLGVLTKEDDQAVVLRIFDRYITLMRKLQFEYWLEPAGSHGVWGLDDYHFLPFLFGSAQLYDHKYIKPKSIHNHEIVNEFAKDYMYLACIKFINEVKTSASLRWHSPMLDDISACKLWAKVNQGMIKMYKAEVMSKLPIMQHFLFGTLIHFEGGSARAEDMHGDCGHVHIQENVFALGQEHPDCCGIPVPSAIAANASSNSPRRIPFD